MGILVPLTIFFLLELSGVSTLLTIAGCTFLGWGVASFLSLVLEQPRLKDRSPGRALREDWDKT